MKLKRHAHADAKAAAVVVGQGGNIGGAAAGRLAEQQGIEPVGQFGADNAYTRPGHHVVNPVAVVIYTEIGRERSHDKARPGYQGRHRLVLFIKKLRAHEGCGGVARRKRVARADVGAALAYGQLHGVYDDAHRGIRHGKHYGAVLERMAAAHSGKVEPVDSHYGRILHIVVYMHLAPVFRHKGISHGALLPHHPSVLDIQRRHANKGGRHNNVGGIEPVGIVEGAAAGHIAAKAVSCTDG